MDQRVSIELPISVRSNPRPPKYEAIASSDLECSPDKVQVIVQVADRDYRTDRKIKRCNQTRLMEGKVWSRQ